MKSLIFLVLDSEGSFLGSGSNRVTGACTIELAFVEDALLLALDGAWLSPSVIARLATLFVRVPAGTDQPSPRRARATRFTDIPVFLLDVGVDLGPGVKNMPADSWLDAGVITGFVTTLGGFGDASHNEAFGVGASDMELGDCSLTLCSVFDIGCRGGRICEQGAAFARRRGIGASPS